MGDVVDGNQPTQEKHPMAYLPIQADNRSQRVRIGGKTILPFITTYVDLGFLSPPTVVYTNNEVGKKAKGRGLKASVYFAYGVTAVDASGTETPIELVAVKTGAVVEAESELDFTVVTITEVAHAVSYNVYRSGVGKTGFATAAEALAAPLKLLANLTPTLAAFTQVYEDANGLAGSEEGTTAPSSSAYSVSNKTYYNTGGTSWSTRHELQNHLTYGAVTVVGPLTPNGNDFVPYGAPWELELKSEEIKVKALTTLLQRSTGLTRAVAEVLPKPLKTAKEGYTRYSAIVYNTLTNLVEGVFGGEELAATATPKTVEATLTKYQQVLVIVRTTHTVKTPEVVSGRDNLLRVYL